MKQIVNRNHPIIASYLDDIRPCGFKNFGKLFVADADADAYLGNAGDRLRKRP